MAIFGFANPRSLHVGLPLEVIDNVGQSLQTDYNQNKAAADQLEILAANVDVAEGDQAIKDNTIGYVRDELSKLATSGDYEMLAPQVQALAKKYTTDQDLNLAVKNKAAMNAQQDLITKMNIEGKNPLVFTPSNGFQTKNEDGSYNYFVSDVQAQLDWDARMKEIWADVLPDAVTSGLITADEAKNLQSGDMESIMRQVGTVTNKGIWESKIQQMLDMASERYKLTDEYKQQYRKLNELDKVEMGKDEKYRQLYIDGLIKNNMANTGLMRTFNLNEINYRDSTLDAMAYQQRMQAEKERKTAEAKYNSAAVVALSGEQITNPARYSNNIGDFGKQASVSKELADAYRKEIYQKEKQLADKNVNLSPNDRAQIEKELTQLKISASFQDWQANQYVSKVTDDYVEWLRAPKGADGGAIKVHDSGNLTELEKQLIESANYDLSEGLHMRYDPEKFVDVANQNEQFKNQVQYIEKVLSETLFNVNGVQVDQIQVNNRFGLDYDKALKTPNGIRTASLKEITGEVLLNAPTDFMFSLSHVDNFKNLKDEDKIKLKNLLNTVDKSSLKQTAVTAYEKVNNTNNQSAYMESISTQTFNPTTYDFSTLPDASDSSGASKRLSQIVTNNVNAFTYIQNGLPAELNDVAKVEITGITDYVPGQGYLLTGKYYTLDPKGQVSPVGTQIYAKPKNGIKDSQINQIVYDTLINSNSYFATNELKSRAVELANAIMDDTVDKQFDRFRLVPAMPNQVIQSQVVVDEDLTLNTERITDEFGNTKYVLRSKDADTSNNKEWYYDSLEAMIGAVEKLNTAVTDEGLVKKYAKDYKSDVREDWNYLDFGKYANVLRGRESGHNYGNKGNSLGYIGAYQMGVGYLETQGLMKKGSLKKVNESRSNQIDVLKDPENWLDGWSYEKFLENPTAQDEVFERATKSALKQFRDAGLITENTPPDVVAGYLFAAHLGGVDGTIKWATKGIDNADANGTTISAYFKLGKASQSIQ